MSFIRSILFPICFSLVVCLPAQAKSVTVLSSIEPLRLIATELLGDDAELTSLLNAGASPHQYALKPSEAMAIYSADLVVWVGPGLEGFMAKTIARGGRIPLQLDRIKELNWPEQAHKHDGHWQRDAHIWLDPNNVALIAKAIASRFKSKPNADAVNTRLELFLAQLQSRQDLWLQQLAADKSQALAVYHNGYQHLAQGLGLSIQTWVSRGEGHSISIKKRWQLQRQLKQKPVPCLLAEPYGERGQAVKFAKSLGLPVVWLDPLAAQRPYSGYFNWMDSQVEQLLQCYQF